MGDDLCKGLKLGRQHLSLLGRFILLGSDPSSEGMDLLYQCLMCVPQLLL